MLHFDFKGYTKFEPFSFLNDGGDLTGFYGEVFKILSERLNFTYTLSTHDDGEELIYGTLQENGQFNGYVGKIQRGELDVTADDFT